MSEIDWREEGRRAFVHSKVREGKPYPRYPTQDTHTPDEEADFISGWNGAEAEWAAGNQLSGFEAYIKELEELEAAEADGSQPAT